MCQFQPAKVDVQDFIIYPNDIKIYNKPLGKSFLYFYVLGPGGNGGTDGGSGGGGGGSGGQTVALIPSKLLPDSLYMFTGIFSSSTPALVIAIQPPSSLPYSSKDSSIIILAYGGKNSVNGSGVGGDGGAAMSSSGTYDGKFHGLGIMASVAGQKGGNGGGGTMYLPTTGTRATGGTGGGSTGNYTINSKSGGGGIFPDTVAGGNYTLNNTTNLPFISYGGIWDLGNYPQNGGPGAGGVGQKQGGAGGGIGGPGLVIIAAW